MAVRELNSTPGWLPLYLRAGAGSIPGVSSLPLIGRGGRGDAIDDLTLVLDEVEIDRDRVARYDRVCGFDLRDTIPATYLHILAFPLQLALMTDPGFPFPAIGLVHIYNRITQHRPVRAAERPSLRVWAGPIEPHPRGKQFSLHSEARVGEELVWEEIATNLRRAKSSEGRAPEVPSAEGLPQAATWRLPGDLGRRYASVSGDFNPIHIHSLTAKLFGFPSAIAHGMWAKARCVAALDARLPDSFTVEAAFKRPILLPSTVNFAASADGDEIPFGVRSADSSTPHLDGVVQSLLV